MRSGSSQTFQWVSVIGDVTPPTTVVVAPRVHPCAVLGFNAAGGFVATNGRQDVTIRDPSLSIVDGTPMLVVDNGGKFEPVWVMCSSEVTLRSLQITPPVGP
jgi:hypothetical protein